MHPVGQGLLDVGGLAGAGDDQGVGGGSRSSPVPGRPGTGCRRSARPAAGPGAPAAPGTAAGAPSARRQQQAAGLGDAPRVVVKPAAIPRTAPLEGFHWPVVGLQPGSLRRPGGGQGSALVVWGPNSRLGRRSRRTKSTTTWGQSSGRPPGTRSSPRSCPAQPLQPLPGSQRFSSTTVKSGTGARACIRAGPPAARRGWRRAQTWGSPRPRARSWRLRPAALGLLRTGSRPSAPGRWRAAGARTGWRTRGEPVGGRMAQDPAPHRPDQILQLRARLAGPSTVLPDSRWLASRRRRISRWVMGIATGHTPRRRRRGWRRGQLVAQADPCNLGGEDRADGARVDGFVGVPADAGVDRTVVHAGTAADAGQGGAQLFVLVDARAAVVQDDQVHLPGAVLFAPPRGRRSG